MPGQNVHKEHALPYPSWHAEHRLLGEQRLDEFGVAVVLGEFADFDADLRGRGEGEIAAVKAEQNEATSRSPPALTMRYMAPCGMIGRIPGMLDNALYAVSAFFCEESKNKERGERPSGRALKDAQQSAQVEIARPFFLTWTADTVSSKNFCGVFFSIEGSAP